MPTFGGPAENLYNILTLLKQKQIRILTRKNEDFDTKMALGYGCPSLRIDEIFGILR
jgi:hypothetical protein